jgi:hypothetical protein
VTQSTLACALSPAPLPGDRACLSVAVSLRAAGLGRAQAGQQGWLGCGAALQRLLPHRHGEEAGSQTEGGGPARACTYAEYYARGFRLAFARLLLVGCVLRGVAVLCCLRDGARLAARDASRALQQQSKYCCRGGCCEHVSIAGEQDGASRHRSNTR